MTLRIGVGALALLALLLVCAAFAEEPPRYVMFQNKDLDGDGRREAIRLVIEDNSRGVFTIMVNGQQVRDKLWENIRGFFIVDLDRRDRYKEIVVHTDGPSDDYGNFLFWYDGRHLHRVGVVGNLRVKGNGYLADGQWCGFWEWWQTCVLDRHHRLRPIHDALYTVDKAGMTVKAFKLYKSRDYKEVAVTVRPGTWVRVLSCDCRGDQYKHEWNYLVRTDKGQRGWTRRGVDNIELPRAD